MAAIGDFKDTAPFHVLEAPVQRVPFVFNSPHSGRVYPKRFLAMARLDAETIRDSMLAVAGRLDPKMGGPGYDLFDKRGGLSGFTPVESFKGDGLRRMIYAHKVRRERDAVFGAFDCPDAGQSTARRRESTTPIQALNLFNAPRVEYMPVVGSTRNVEYYGPQYFLSFRVRLR